MRVVNAYTVRPDEVADGDVMLFTVKAIATPGGGYKLWRCQYQGPSDPDDPAFPQGMRLGPGSALGCARAMFPVLTIDRDPD